VPPARATAIIPARLGSTRFPGKVLADDTGRPMVVHVCERATMARSVGRVVVATDAHEVADAVRSHGYEAILTSPDHPNGTSRLAEAAAALKLNDQRVIVNVQGDEPEIEPEIIDGAVDALGVQLNASWEVGSAPHLGGEAYAVVGTVASPLATDDDPADPNIVKAVVGVVEPRQGVARALCFTRASVPYFRQPAADAVRLRHVGIYAYTHRALRGYLGLPPTPLEQAEQLEQLRWLEHGLPVAVAVRTTSSRGIDTPAQYADFVRHLRADVG